MRTEDDVTKIAEIPLIRESPATVSRPKPTITRKCPIKAQESRTLIILGWVFFGSGLELALEPKRGKCCDRYGRDSIYN